jgi:hypothetical protein
VLPEPPVPESWTMVLGVETVVLGVEVAALLGGSAAPELVEPELPPPPSKQPGRAQSNRPRTIMRFIERPSLVLPCCKFWIPGRWSGVSGGPAVPAASTTLQQTRCPRIQLYHLTYLCRLGKKKRLGRHQKDAN